MVVAILAISIICVTGCAQQSPFIPEFIQPPDGYYIELTPMQIEEALLSHYGDPELAKKKLEGKSLIIKNITVDESVLSTLREDYIYFSCIKCIPQRPADLSDLKEGDVIDITGVFVDIPLSAGESMGVIVLANCQFLPAGMYPLPLPGSPAFPIAGY